MQRILGVLLAPAVLALSIAPARARAASDPALPVKGGQTTPSADHASAPGSQQQRAAQPQPAFELAGAPLAELRLRQAAYAWSMGDLREAAAQLEQIAPSTPGFAGADRAAFLLAEAYLRLGEPQRFLALARAKAAHPTGSPWDLWLRYRFLTATTDAAAADSATLAAAANAAPARLPAADVLVAALLVRAGETEQAKAALQRGAADAASPVLRLYVQALAEGLPAQSAAAPDSVSAAAPLAVSPAPPPARAQDARADWERTLQELVAAEPKTPLDLDLVGAAHLRLASLALRRGQDAIAQLEAVPKASRYAADARLMLALTLLEAGASGEAQHARALLASIAQDDPSPRRRRDAQRELAALALEAEDWQDAHELNRALAKGWDAQHDTLTSLLDPAAAPLLWDHWSTESMASCALVLETAPLDREAAALVEASLDLRAPLEESAFAGAPASASLWQTTDQRMPDAPAPTAQEWDAVQQSLRREEQAASELERARRAVDEERARLARRRAYLDRGLQSLGSTTRALVSTSQRLDSLLAVVDGIAGQLAGVKSEFLRSAAVRTRALVQHQQLELDHLLFLRHFYVDGPNRQRPDPLPEGVPSPEALLQREEALSLQVAAFLDTFAVRAPRIVQRSYAEVWEPRVTLGTRGLAEQARRRIAWANRLHSGIDSTRTAGFDSAELRALRAGLAVRQAAADSARSATAQLRTAVASAAVQRALDALAGEREGIDYGLGVSAHELAVGRGRDHDDPTVRAELAAARQEAIAQLDAFLTSYPGSPARGEVRFRLADLLMLSAKEDFNGKMAQFLSAAQAQGSLDARAMAPFVDYEPALRLYRRILAEDPGFPHQDAVLFNIGMILSDAGSEEAQGVLERLVSTHPQSEFCQEAWLRMGDNRFDQKDYEACVPLYARAAAGTDNELTAIALYKMGWAHFNQDRFLDSADAFRRLFDLYESGAAVRTSTDLRAEAQDYLIHALCRAGGAQPFADYFKGVGPRPYEARILQGMGTLLRKFSLYGDAAKVDELWLARYPNEAQALDVAQRLVDTYERSNKPEQARAARLATAPRFVEGSPWFTANAADSLRQAGRRYALESYKSVALYHHHQARDGAAGPHWEKALELYQTLLARWPTDPEAPRFHFYAGEAAAHLNDFRRALDHYAAAAACDTASFRADALWQRVAVTDAWYESTRKHVSSAQDRGLGADSLATAVSVAADTLVKAYPRDARAADVLWRQATLAYAHGRNDRAAPAFERLMHDHPQDPRAPMAARLRGDAIYRQGAYDRAADAYEQALLLAKAARVDTLVARLAPVIPLCRVKHAEAVAASDSAHPGRAAKLFAEVAARWPDYAHADLALYRAGLGYARARSAVDAVRCWSDLIARHPRSEYVRDAHLQIAVAWEAARRPRDAAEAYRRFAQAYPKDQGAAAALLKSADLLASAGDAGAAEDARTLYMDRFPGDVETAMEILQRRALAELAQVGSSTALSALLGKPGKGSALPASSLARYLDLANTHASLASPQILAQVAFLQAEEQMRAYEAVRLTQPLKASLAAKKKRLESVLESYRACAQRGVNPFASASAYRIGEALVHFGDALRGSEGPAQLSADDLAAYRQVLEEQSWEFYDRGEEAWSELLKRAGSDPGDEGGWIARTRSTLWPRLAQRFAFRPEAAYPLVSAQSAGDGGVTSQ
jgi:tetratricopeptide (TPR) repeat protein